MSSKTTTTRNKETRSTRAARRANRRALRAAVRTRTRTHRARTRIARRGTATLAAHAVAAGLTVREARSAAGTMRKCATRLGITGTEGVSYAGRYKARPCRRYTPVEAAHIAADYRTRARKAAYRTAATRMVLAA